jgi:hypothetical protein
METEIKNKPHVRKYVLAVIATFILIFLIYYSVMNLLSPVKKLEELKQEYAFRQDEKNKIDERVFNDSAYLKLLKDRSFLQSRVTMAETDSIYLTINLADSMVNLEISGVCVHKTKIKKLNTSKMLRDDNSYTISSFLSKPFNISKNYSSILKVPLMIKMAPKDTSEYVPDIFPDTADYEPVNYILEIDNGTRIIVYQDEKLNPGDNMHLSWFDLQYRFRNTLESLKSSLTFKVPEYHPFIKLRLPRSDAKIIYRALPEHGQIAVYR